MKIFLVCGGRHYTDYLRLCRVLNLHVDKKEDMICHGNAPGADTLAERWAKANEVDYAGFPAKWRTHGNSAGPIRNTRMLDRFAPDLVIAFPGKIGTPNMIAQAEARGINVIKVK
jgi:hypothetical protein